MNNRLSSTLAVLLLATTTQALKVETETEFGGVFDIPEIPNISLEPDTVFGSLIAAQSGENWAGVAQKVD